MIIANKKGTLATIISLYLFGGAASVAAAPPGSATDQLPNTGTDTSTPVTNASSPSYIPSGVTDYDRKQQQMQQREKVWNAVDTTEAPQSVMGWSRELSGVGRHVDADNLGAVRDLYESLKSSAEFEAYLSEVEDFQDNIDIIDMRTNEFEDLDYNWVASGEKDHGEWQLVSEGTGEWTPKIRGDENFNFTQTRNLSNVYQRTVQEIEQNLVNPNKTRPSNTYIETKEMQPEGADGSSSTPSERNVYITKQSTRECTEWSPRTSSTWYPVDFTQEQTCKTVVERWYDGEITSEQPTINEYIGNGECTNKAYEHFIGWEGYGPIYETRTLNFTTADKEELENLPPKPVNAWGYPTGEDPYKEEREELEARLDQCESFYAKDHPEGRHPINEFETFYGATNKSTSWEDITTNTRQVTGTKGIYQLRTMKAKDVPSHYRINSTKPLVCTYSCPETETPENVANKECGNAPDGGIKFGWSKGSFGLPGHTPDPNETVTVAECKPR